MFDFVLARISMVWMFIFFMHFLPRAHKPSKSILMSVVCFSVCTLCDYLTAFEPECGLGTISNTLLQAGLLQLTVFIACKYHDGRALFVGLTGAAYVLLGNALGVEFYVWSGHFFAGLFIAVSMHFLVFTLLYIKLREAFLAQLEKQERRWLRLCIIPFLFYLSVYSVMVWPADIDENPENLLGILFILILMIASYTIIFSSMHNYEKLEKQRADLALMEKYAAGMRQQLELMRVNEEKSAILRHDMKHFSVVLSGFLKNREYDKFEEAMAGTVSRLEELKCEPLCENVSVNSIVSQYLAEAKGYGIKFDCRMDVPMKLPVDEFEFAVVLSNLLSNAVREAAADAGHPGEVRIQAQRVKGQLAIEVSNTYTNEVEFGADGLPVSKRGVGHGYGSRSIQAFVRKYGAVYDCQIENNWFFVRLAMKL